ncbi:MAG: CDP-alcohol phosphatidyltransferase family protein [Bacteroidetes bacterium]|nr:CDP-alcohol phosphatidyltransferase family protein [Bacteroidota bacterium]MDA0859679.1 CDP-alcohol phosphatidyltransferase family protein [Bacteroidota bacterium]MDA1317735.1 CDP-alcohol phosphatidyltransferase family protein [Bacteroidota bacterium]
MKTFVPNFITLLNLLSGAIATIFAIEGHMTNAALFVFLGIFFDFLDGFFARKLNVTSELGLQLDSLADMVTSGLVPALVLFHLLELTIAPSWDTYHILPYFGLLVALASAYRLAKFNISTEQSSYFIGLPTPANALLIMSLPLILAYQNNDSYNTIILNPIFLITVTIISCFLLNAPIKLIALKFKTWKFSENASRYILIIFSIVALIVFKFAGIPLLIIFYIILSIINPPYNA